MYQHLFTTDNQDMTFRDWFLELRILPNMEGLEDQLIFMFCYPCWPVNWNKINLKVLKQS